MSGTTFQKRPYSEFIKELLGAVFPGAFLLFSLFFIFFGPVFLLDLMIRNPNYNIMPLTLFTNVVQKNVDLFSTISLLVIFLIFAFVFGSIYYRRTCDLPNQQSIYKNLTKDYAFLSMIDKKHRYFSRTNLRRAVCRYINRNEDRDREIDMYIRKNYAINGLSSIGVIKVSKILFKPNLKAIVGNPVEYLNIRKYKHIKTSFCSATCQIESSCNHHGHDKKCDLRSRDIYVLGKKKVHIRYPFTCIHRYLLHKGYSDLALKAICPTNGHRKNYINQIKVKLRNDFSSVTELDKIEAHIRYSSSMWYISKSVTKLAHTVLALFLIFATIIFTKKGFFSVMNNAVYANIYLVTFTALMFIGIYFVCFRLSNYIENYLHNQRLTEIIMALQIMK